MRSGRNHPRKQQLTTSQRPLLQKVHQRKVPRMLIRLLHPLKLKNQYLPAAESSLQNFQHGNRKMLNLLLRIRPRRWKLHHYPANQHPILLDPLRPHHLPKMHKRVLLLKWIVQASVHPLWRLRPVQWKMHELHHRIRAPTRSMHLPSPGI